MRNLEETFEYDSQNRLKRVRLGPTLTGASVNDSYDHQRILMEEHVGNRHRTKRYVGNCEYITKTNGNDTEEQWLTYLTGSTGIYAVVMTKSGRSQLFYVLKDNLGSWTTITDENGEVEQHLNYDAWGNLRNPNYWTGFFSGVPMFDRGFTGHEHYDRLHIINANARLYDPTIGRFFSPDPFVQAPDFTQSFNRYSYCMNNPVMYSDEDGEFWHIIAGAIIGGVYNWLVNGAELSWQGLAYFGIGAAAGALGAGVGAGLASVYAGSTFSAGFMGSVTTASSSLGVIGGFSSGFAGGFVNGFTSGLGNGLIQTKSFTMALGNAFENGIQQGFAGGVTGGLAGGYFAYMAGNHPLTGQKPYLDISLKNYQNVLQNNPSNCKNAILESIEKMNGGTRTQDDFKKLGDAYLEAHPNAHGRRNGWHDVIPRRQKSEERRKNPVSNGGIFCYLCTS